MVSFDFWNFKLSKILNKVLKNVALRIIKSMSSGAKAPMIETQETNHNFISVIKKTPIVIHANWGFLYFLPIFSYNLPIFPSFLKLSSPVLKMGCLFNKVYLLCKHQHQKAYNLYKTHRCFHLGMEYPFIQWVQISNIIVAYENPIFKTFSIRIALMIYKVNFTHYGALSTT